MKTELLQRDETKNIQREKQEGVVSDKVKQILLNFSKV